MNRSYSSLDLVLFSLADGDEGVMIWAYFEA